MKGLEEHCTSVRATAVQVGWLLPPQQHGSSAGSQQDLQGGREQGAGLSPIPANEIKRKATLMGVANTCRLGTAGFLSVEEKCAEGEEGEAGRTQGS